MAELTQVIFTTMTEDQLALFVEEHVKKAVLDAFNTSIKSPPIIEDIQRLDDALHCPAVWFIQSALQGRKDWMMTAWRSTEEAALAYVMHLNIHHPEFDRRIVCYVKSP